MSSRQVKEDVFINSLIDNQSLEEDDIFTNELKNQNLYYRHYPSIHISAQEPIIYTRSLHANKSYGKKFIESKDFILGNHLYGKYFHKYKKINCFIIHLIKKNLFFQALGILSTIISSEKSSFIKELYEKQQLKLKSYLESYE